MNGKTYSFRIVTEDSVFYEGRVSSIVVRGELGYLGVLANHAPLVTTCVPGKLMFRDGQGMEHTYQTGNGFFEVLRNEATLFTDGIAELGRPGE